MEIDVRKFSEQKVESVRFADTSTIGGVAQADVIQLAISYEVQIKESSNGDYVRLNSKQHAENLIKAINKAIDLGWLK